MAAGIATLLVAVLCATLLLGGGLGGIRGAAGQLSVDFYANSCPNVEAIVLGVVKAKFQESQIAPPATLRLFFHDCFVRGCDGSVLISSRGSNVAERDAQPNLSLAGDAFDSVVQAKKAVEAKCPGVVSCADLLAIAARDFVGLVGGPTWEVQKGRRDGRVSLASEAAADLPGADFDVDKLVASFGAKGLSQDDMVALSGAHTIGFSHCDSFSTRLYGFSQSAATDPSMDAAFASDLKQACPKAGDPGQVEPLDVTTSFQFDKAYYANLAGGKGLLFSDQVLFTDARTRGLVRVFSKRTPKFFDAFVAAITKMGAIGVLTGSQGEIRKDCTAIN